MRKRTSNEGLPNTDRQAEEAMIGSMLIDKSQIGPVIGLIVGEDVSDSGLRILFREVREMYLAGEIHGDEIDPVLLDARLQRKGYSHTEIAELVRGLINACPNSLRAMEYARIVLRHALERHKQSIAMQLLQGDLTIDEAQAALIELDARRKGGAPGWQPTVQSLDELMDQELRPVRWAVEEIIGEGVTLLAAKPKKGKTVLMLQIAMCVANGALALSHAKTQQGEVLYLALEENERRMQRRAERILMGERPPKGVHLVYDWPQFTNDGIDALSRWMDEHPNTRLIVIDTLERVRPTRRGNGNIYAEDYAAVKDIQRFAGLRQVSVVVIHHTGKSGREDPLDEVSGSTGLTGGVDNILVMRSVNGLTELHRQGRDYTENNAIALKGDPETLMWRYAGDADEVRRSDAQKAILETLQDEPDGMTPTEIAGALGVPAGRVRVMLHRMMKKDDSAITKVGGDKYVITCNAGNAGNVGNTQSPEPGKQANSYEEVSVTGSVTALQGAKTGGNTGKVLEFKPDAYSVTSVTSVTGACEHPQHAVRTLRSGRTICGHCGTDVAPAGA